MYPLGMKNQFKRNNFEKERDSYLQTVSKEN